MCEHARHSGFSGGNTKSPSPQIKPQFPPSLFQEEGSQSSEATTGGFYRRVYPSIRNLFSTLQKTLSGVPVPHTDEKIAQVSDMLQAMKIDEKEWSDFARFDGQKYTRNLIAHDKDFTVLLLCWNKGQRSPIHDHAGSSCWVKCLKGTLRERRFSMPDTEKKKMELISVADCNQGEVCYIRDEQGVHEMGNPSSETVTVTMHFYCPAYYSCSAFDEFTSERRCVSMLAAAAPLREVLGPVNNAAAATGAVASSATTSGSSECPPPPNSISLHELVKMLDNPQTDEAKAVKGFGQLYLGKMEWSSFVHFSDYRFQRLLLHSDHRFSLLMLCWLPGQATPPHNHRGSKSWVRVLAGELGYCEVDEQGGKIESSCAKLTQCMENPFVEDDTLAVHVVGNYTDNYAISLHLYTPPYTDLTYTDTASMAKNSPNTIPKQVFPEKNEALEKLELPSSNKQQDANALDNDVVESALGNSGSPGVAPTPTKNAAAANLTDNKHCVIPYACCQQALHFHDDKKQSPEKQETSAPATRPANACGCKLLSNFFILQEKLGMAFAASSTLQELSVGVLELLEEAVFSPQELEQYWSIRDRIDYRVRLHDSEYFCVSLNLWNPGHESVIHDHDGSLSWLKVLDGALMDTIYNESSDGSCLEESHTSRHTTGGVTYYGSNTKHALANMSKTRRAISIHVYCSRDCCETTEATTSESRSLVQFGTQQGCRWYTRSAPKQGIRVVSVTAVEDINWMSSVPVAGMKNWSWITPEHEGKK